MSDWAWPPVPASTRLTSAPEPRVAIGSTWTTASIELVAATPMAKTRVSEAAATGRSTGPKTTGPEVAVGTMSTG